MATHYTYFGVNIFRNTSPGYALKYTARTESGQVAAHTLAEIRALIRERR